jgi:nucleoside-diphosphate-sugar epimerase
MKLVITGALGHIGSRLIHSVAPGEFEEIILIDNLLTQRYCSLFNLPEGIRWRFLDIDVTAENANLEKPFAGADAVIHLAAITNAAASFDIQEEVERVNYVGTERVARACAEVGCRLLFLSTTSVYGVADGIVDEGCPTEQLKPQSPYAESKLRAEQLLVEQGRVSGLRFFVGRFGTIYGKSIGMRFHTAVNKFIWQACLGQSLSVWRTALDQKRPYLELGDAVEAIRFILQKDLFDNEIYNVLTDNLTVRQITDAIRKYVPNLRIELVESQIMNQLSYTVAKSKFESHGFRFKGDLDQAIRDSIHLLQPLATSEQFPDPGPVASAGSTSE